MQRDAESEDLADFAVAGTYDQSTNMLGSQKYHDFCTWFFPWGQEMVWILSGQGCGRQLQW